MFLGRLILPLILLRTVAPAQYRHPSSLFSPREVTINVLLLAAIISAFTGNAGDWFKKTRRRFATLGQAVSKHSLSLRWDERTVSTEFWFDAYSFNFRRNWS